MVAVASLQLGVSFFCRGKPVAKGSMIVRHIHGQWVAPKQCTCRNYAVAVDDARLQEWHDLLATAAARAMKNRPPFEGAVRVTMTFFYERPKSHTRAQRASRWVIAKGRNDSDKLARAVLDACTSAAVWDDDSQAMLGAVDKLYCDEDERPGVMVSLEALT